MINKDKINKDFNLTSGIIFSVPSPSVHSVEEQFLLILSLHVLIHVKFKQLSAASLNYFLRGCHCSSN